MPVSSGGSDSDTANPQIAPGIPGRPRRPSFLDASVPDRGAGTPSLGKRRDSALWLHHYEKDRQRRHPQ
ncbi:hypothetical protein HYPDE_40998 [Hyphomicrobium denitrificans 1NES1]|uniref:Uncharacterized protein n=1 Tax=Hyphomicrobium denitrificans 1NES1 TaxID=670307 RepID=N0BA28_9HYPH|nr:hypothetical protein HYPDE_40998 [Hyphomicrobium denitrificans 1NES1]